MGKARGEQERMIPTTSRKWVEYGEDREMIAVVEAKSRRASDLREVLRRPDRFDPRGHMAARLKAETRRCSTPLNSERQAIRLLIDAQSATQLKLQEELVAWRDSSYRLEQRVRQLERRLAERDRFDRLEE
jgi:hypothetical protein